MNIPPRATSENGLLGRLSGTLAIAVALCATLTACRFELAVDAGSLAPSVSEVRTLLAQDRVRQALDRANSLVQQHRGPETDIVLAWSLWRNGSVREAESRFRRVAEAGLAEGNVGLAAVAASQGDWMASEELAAAGLAASESSALAHAVLAGAAWAAGDRETSVRELRAWSAAESSTPRRRAAEAMAAAAGDLRGPLHRWEGIATSLPLVETASGALAVEASIGGQEAILAIDLTFRQSLVSEQLAVAAGLSVVGAAMPGVREASSRWPSILSPRQVGCSAIEFGGMSLRNVVVAVADPPPGTDGVLAIDLLSSARWSLDPGRRILVLGPPEGGAANERSATDAAIRTVAWLSARLIHEGTTTQLLLFPRVQGNVISAGLDVAGTSLLDSDLLPVRVGSGAAPTELALGGWKGEALWRPAALAGWAADGGIAPLAVLGGNLVEGWSLHWYPGSSQLRVDAPVTSFE